MFCWCSGLRFKPPAAPVMRSGWVRSPHAPQHTSCLELPAAWGCPSLGDLSVIQSSGHAFFSQIPSSHRHHWRPSLISASPMPLFLPSIPPSPILSNQARENVCVVIPLPAAATTPLPVEETSQSPPTAVGSSSLDLTSILHAIMQACFLSCPLTWHNTGSSSHLDGEEGDRHRDREAASNEN